MNDDVGDKSYEPTPKKLDDARKKGEITRSADLTTAAGYLGFAIVCLLFGEAMVTRLGGRLALIIDQAGSTRAPPIVISSLVGPVAPIIFLPGLAALISIVARNGLLFTTDKLKPKLSRISPIATAKQKFGRSGLFEFLKSFTKLLVHSVVLGFFLNANMPRILTALTLEPSAVPGELCTLALDLILLVLIVAAIIGGIDAIFQAQEHRRKNMMSRKEIMDETKESEGDPAMKQSRRQKAVEIATRKMVAEVPNANVVIVNPTHFAVALKWSREAKGAPVCVAKGVDEIARRIREIAEENNVPIHSDPPTARALHELVDVGKEIPPDHYKAVAAAIRFAELVREKAKWR
ncbi:flagellar type III secretion system protein FlhB [Pelagovum pacificum]|uniref:Flagellar biosynthesis protein FlhB n=1 Tax=Pelagovum pacificum TaxID=2588711 RepID=A0A5C5GH27_9RHOB|nr:flagellar type III secretion system protein FlhB [Pelagovum pacificum]QQA42975.1 flagellar biosynthesis protein FlhB [Pelagovum pacificum]TNY33880.1 flagellar biosynthesis protein FlhB [Pelagovum pacificum]